MDDSYFLGSLEYVYANAIRLVGRVPDDHAIHLMVNTIYDRQLYTIAPDAQGVPRLVLSGDDILLDRFKNEYLGRGKIRTEVPFDPFYGVAETIPYTPPSGQHRSAGKQQPLYSTAGRALTDSEWLAIELQVLGWDTLTRRDEVAVELFLLGCRPVEIRRFLGRRTVGVGSRLYPGGGCPCRGRDGHKHNLSRQASTKIEASYSGYIHE